MQKKQMMTLCMLLMTGTILAQEQQKYDKAIGKILTEEQMEGYLKIKPQFASQRRIREFLLGNPLNMMNNENGL